MVTTQGSGCRCARIESGHKTVIQYNVVLEDQAVGIVVFDYILQGLIMLQAQRLLRKNQLVFASEEACANIVGQPVNIPIQHVLEFDAVFRKLPFNTRGSILVSCLDMQDINVIHIQFQRATSLPLVVSEIVFLESSQRPDETDAKERLHDEKVPERG